MSTYATLVSEIRGDIHRGSDFDARIKAAICAAIRHYRVERLRFNTTHSYILSTSASAEYYAIPTLVEIDAVTLQFGDDRLVVYERSWDWIEERARPNVIGQPTHFAIQDSQLRPYPLPERTYSLALAMHIDLTEISISASDAATNAWMTEGFDLIKQRALGDLHMNYIRADSSREDGAAAWAQAADILKSLKRRANREQSTGRIRPYCV